MFIKTTRLKGGINWPTISLLIVGAVLGFMIITTFYNAVQHPCYRPYSYDCKAYETQLCIEANIYTRQECIQLVGSK